MDAERRIEELQLQPHPEGGYYRRIFRSAIDVAPADGRPPRPALTSVYFLLPAGSVSRWHRVLSDEAWAHLEGGPLHLWTFDEPTGALERRLLSPSPAAEPVLFVHAGLWQAAEPTGASALVACFVGPGFDFTDFRMASGDPEAVRRLRAAGPGTARLL